MAREPWEVGRESEGEGRGRSNLERGDEDLGNPSTPPPTPHEAGNQGEVPQRYRLWWWSGVVLLLLAGLAGVAVLYQGIDLAQLQTRLSDPTSHGAIPSDLADAKANLPPWLPENREIPLDLPANEPLQLPSVQNLPAAPEPGVLSAVTMIAEVLTLVSTPASGESSPGTLLTASLGGHLRCYSLPSLRLRGDWRLDRPIYDMVLDSRAGLLYTICAESEQLTLGPREERPQVRGDLVVYDVGQMLAGRGTLAKDLRPAWRLPLATQILGLQLDHRGENLFLLGGTPIGAFLARLELQRKQIDHWLPLRQGAGALRLAPDGRTLYVTTPGQILAIDPVSFALRGTLPIQGCATQLVVDQRGRIFFSDRTQGIDLMEVDFPHGKIVGRWALPFRSRLSLALSPDDKRLFASTNTVAVNQVWCLALDGAATERPLLKKRAFGNQTGRLRGPSFLTADGTLLINAGGLVFPVDSSSDLECDDE